MFYLNRFILLTVFFLSTALLAQHQSFNEDSAYAYTEHLSVTIGPRLMGSANEQKALRWMANKFKSFGADTTYVMHFYKSRGGVNTNCGNAVGVFPGASDSIIVIGGHIDSDKFNNPGASDNASGTACTIELARIWSKASRKYTLVFVGFGAEESGIVGSQYFADHFEQMDKVALMFSIDMAGSEGWLIPFIDVNTHQAPQWLVEDSYAIDRALGYNSLVYPTHFFSINSSIPGGAAGSDHIPFLNKNIAAIDFTSGINVDPIHTSQDRIEFLSKPMLARSGRLVDGLINKYQQNGIPKETQGHYMLWESPLGRLYFPVWLLVSVNILAVILGLLALFQARKFRLDIGKEKKVRFSALKLFLMLIIIAVFSQLGEGLMQIIKEQRYPWLIHFDKYMWFAALWALAGIWVCLFITNKWRFNPDPYLYLLRAVIFLLLLIILFGFGSARLAIYPSLTLLMLAIIVNVSNSALKTTLAVLAPLPLFRLMFNEILPFVAQSSIPGGFQMTDFSSALIYSAILTALMVFWFLPIIYLYVYTLKSAPFILKFARLFRKPSGGIVVLVIIAAYGGYLYSFPAYSDKWKATVLVKATYDQQTGDKEITISGNEFLKGVSVKSDDFERQYHSPILKDELPLTFDVSQWLEINGTEVTGVGDKDTVSVNWQVISREPWLKNQLLVQTEHDSIKIDTIITNLNYRRISRGIQMIWTAEPPDTINIEAKFVIPPSVKLIREVKATYPFAPVPVTIKADHAEVVQRTVITVRDTLDFSR